MNKTTFKMINALSFQMIETHNQNKVPRVPKIISSI